VYVIFGEAADAIAATVNAASSGSHFVITFMILPPVRFFLVLYTFESQPRSTTYFQNLFYALSSTCLRLQLRRELP
jgi:hypothetical protein